MVKRLHKTAESGSFPLFSILIWNDHQTEEEYNTDLPKDFKQLNEYLGSRTINLEEILGMFYEHGLDLCTHIPITYAIKRPKKVVGYNGVWEFITYVLDASSFKRGHYASTADVSIRAHIEPFSTIQAEQLSGEARNGSTLYVGAGSLGSKLLMHDARAGKKHIEAVDKDELLEHNLARHVLFANRIGWSKATAVIQEALSLYSTETKNFKALPGNFEDVTDHTLKNYQLLVDSTASSSVLNQLAIRNVPKDLNISRCEIVDDGRLGLLYIEGTNRNPRVDDLVILTYYYATKNVNLKSWRIHDAAKQPTQIDIGLGCSSTTTVMSDDVISYHAATFSRLLYLHRDRATLRNRGLVCLSILPDGGFNTGNQDHFLVDEFDLLICLDGSGWQLRFRHGLIEQLKFQCRKNKRIETGGILVGTANYKTKTVHILDVITEPRDSRGTKADFARGIRGLPAKVNDIKRVTGEVVGYIGEWHTHPMGLEKLSTQDLETIEHLRGINQEVPIPTVAILITNDKVLPFVFE
jgi:hypothetical protein